MALHPSATFPSFDVIVVGGGPSGVAAALAAARRGAKTLLIERYGFCGGMATAALVNPFSGHAFYDQLAPKGERLSLIGGIFKEIAQALADGGGFGSVLMDAAFDEELLKRVYDERLTASGVSVRYHTQLCGVRVENGRIVAVKTFSKAGEEIFSAGTFVDCSGDGDLAALAGCPFDFGRPSDGMAQAMTVSFRMANVDKAPLYATGAIRDARALVEPYFQKALADGSLHYPYRNFVHFYDYPRPGVLHFNMTRVTDVSGLSAGDLTRAEVEGRRQAFVMGAWLVKSVPYFAEAFVDKVACQVGVRETRHIRGHYQMTTDDIVEGRKFADGIARSRYFIDIHNPKGSVDTHQVAGGKGRVGKGFSPPDNDFYEIPFRCLVTDACKNVLVACRALSASHEAAAAVRVMATMHGVGEAAGIAAARASHEGIDVSAVSGEWVRSQIDYMNRPPEGGALWNDSFGGDHSPAAREAVRRFKERRAVEMESARTHAVNA